MALHWLLEIDYHDGFTLRLSTEGVTVATAAGDVLTYDPGILSDLDGVAAGDDSVAVQIEIPLGVDLLQLEHSAARLYLWDSAEVYERAELYCQGLVSGVEYGAADDPIEFSISRSEDDVPPMPDPQAAIVDGETWPVDSGLEVKDSYNGIAYPIVYGYPGGKRNSATTGTLAVVPVGLAQFLSTDFNDSLLVIADQPLQAGTASSEVYLANFGSDPYTFSTLPWRYKADLLGRMVTVADFATDHPFMPGGKDSSAEFYAGFTPAKGGGRATDAYAVVLDVLRRFGGSRPVDYGAMVGIEPLLSRYAVDTWINDPTTAWDWLDSVLLPLLPVQWVQGRAGVYLAPDRVFASASDVTRAINVDDGEAERRSPVRIDGSALENEITIQFWRSREGGYFGRRILTAQSGNLSQPWWATSTDERVIAHPLAASSQARYGLHRGPPVMIDWTWDALTVQLIGQDLIERRAFPSETVVYWFPNPVQTGDVLSITDSEMGWADRLVIVYRPPVRTIDGWTATLRLVPLT